MDQYYLGLDLGSGTLGWAVTNESYDIIKRHGKSLWGVRLFENANTAEERRIFRTARRRLDRRNWRLDLLQELFASEINAVDDGFFLRLEESKYYPEDKKDKYGNTSELPYNLFIDKNYTDKDYHKQFPTIYHLRKYLMETKETPDVRLVYLALHHIMKHRGHFLLNGDFDSVKRFDEAFESLITELNSEEYDFHITAPKEILGDIETILKDKNKSKNDKKRELSSLLGANTTCEKNIINLIIGGKVKLSDIFNDTTLDETDRSKIAFSDAGYDDYAAEVETLLQEKYVIIEKAKMIYDWSVLSDILKDYDSISESKVVLYEKHKEDLKYLKKVVKKYLPKEYKRIFVYSKDKVCNYPAYIGMTKVNGKKISLDGKKCSREDFYKFIKKNVIEKINDSEVTSYLLEEIEKETFLPKQKVNNNGVIPHQIHLYELEKIISNLEERIPLLKENRNKLIELFKFRVPYYVGPLNGVMLKNGESSWAVRNSNDKIYPWNFDEVINKDASQEKFITRMTNACTYLSEEKVLPKYSLLYSKYMVLNELNNLRINGEKISIELKQDIYENLFEKKVKVTQKRLKDHLLKNGIIDAQAEITGIDGDFKNSLTSYHDLKRILTNTNLSQSDKELIIYNITLFGEDKDKTILRQRLSKLFTQLTKDQVKALANLSYKGWGRLSKAFLEDIESIDPVTGQVLNVINMLWETNDNLMQLLSSKYTFFDQIEAKQNNKQIDTINYKVVDDLYVSPTVKRQIWQTLLVVKELKKVLGQAPKRVFIEMAREKQESKRTESRKDKLVKLYEACRREEATLYNQLKNETENHQLRSDKLYLYYTQKGRCMYTDQPILLKDLYNDNLYDIDHIYPQSKVIDDSIDNRVLVQKTINKNKSDIYPISNVIQKNMAYKWKELLDGGFISKEKYYRLTRKDEFTEDELAGFIQRQIVETRQSTKAVASLLQQIFPETEIVYVKAGNVSKFRQDFELIKVREMNDLHHAKDAYLNIIVGNGYHVKFTKNASWFIKEGAEKYNLDKMFKGKFDIKRNGEIAWKAGSNGTIVNVRKTMSKNNILVTRRSYVEKGKLFNVQLMKKGKGQVPIKSNDDRIKNIEKYGGYNSATGAYFVLVESGLKNKRKRSIEFIPLYLMDQLENNQNLMLEYLITDKELNNPVIILPKIKINTLFEINGFKMWLTGRYDAKRLLLRNSHQLILDKDNERILKKVQNFIYRKKKDKDLKINEYDEISDQQLLNLYNEFINKLENSIFTRQFLSEASLLREKYNNFAELSMEDKCVIIFEVLHYFQTSSQMPNLTLIGGNQVKNPTISKNIKDDIYILNESVTGIYCQKINLMNL